MKLPGIPSGPIMDLGTLGRARTADDAAEDDGETVILFRGTRGETNMEVQTSNIDCAQAWAASRVLALMGDDLYRSGQLAARAAAKNGDKP